MEKMRANNAAKDAKIGEQRATIEKLEAIIEELRSNIAEKGTSSPG